MNIKPLFDKVVIESVTQCGKACGIVRGITQFLSLVNRLQQRGLGVALAVVVAVSLHDRGVILVANVKVQCLYLGGAGFINTVIYVRRAVFDVGPRVLPHRVALCVVCLGGVGELAAPFLACAVKNVCDPKVVVVLKAGGKLVKELCTGIDTGVIALSLKSIAPAFAKRGSVCRA